MTQPGTLDLVASFPHRSDVKRAVLDLERDLDADRIDLTGLVDTTQELGRREADRELAKDFGTRSLGGAVLGAVVGAVVVGGIVLATGVDPQPAAPLAATAGGAGAGGGLGFIYGIYSRTPVTEGGVESSATRVGDDGRAQLVIHLDDPSDADGLGDRLRHLGADEVQVLRRTA